jgi:membrane-associated protein
MLLLDIVDFLRKLWEEPGKIFNPEELIRQGGFVLLLLMVFAESGIFFCFFFPGDSLIFTAGVLTATRDLHHNIFTVIISMVIAATLGNLVGYAFGRTLGPMAYQRRETWFFRRTYLKMAEDFYNKYGGLALMAGRFFPIIRTFAPIVAGIIKLDFWKFLMYSVLGAILWVAPLVTAGYLLGRISFVKDNLELIIIGLVIVITSPVIVGLIRESKKLKAEKAAAKN